MYYKLVFCQTMEKCILEGVHGQDPLVVVEHGQTAQKAYNNLWEKYF